jgi:hypothetical protein
VWNFVDQDLILTSFLLQSHWTAAHWLTQSRTGVLALLLMLLLVVMIR